MSRALFMRLRLSCRKLKGSISTFRAAYLIWSSTTPSTFSYCQHLPRETGVYIRIAYSLVYSFSIKSDWSLLSLWLWTSEIKKKPLLLQTALCHLIFTGESLYYKGLGRTTCNFPKALNKQRVHFISIGYTWAINPIRIPTPGLPGDIGGKAPFMGFGGKKPADNWSVRYCRRKKASEGYSTFGTVN